MLLSLGALLGSGSLCTAAAQAAAAKAAAPAPAQLTVRGASVGPAVPAGFVGIATEYWNVESEVGTDPTKPDVPFENVVRNLAPYGGLSLRIGGDSTDWTWWPIPGMAQPQWVRWTMTPTWAAVTKRLVGDLHAHLIVGLNMEAGSVKIASAEMHEIQAGVGGSAPITYELGNEPELYSHFAFYRTKAGQAVLGRPKSYSLTSMDAQWNDMVNALPGARFAGPGYSGLSALPYVSQFVQQSHRLSLLTVHTYPLKSTRCNGGASLQERQLFEPQSLQALASGLASWASVTRRYGVGLRVDEMNSVTCGGLPGFSGSFGPALWALNVLPLYAEAGVNGVNFQSRPYTAQNLIQTLHRSAGWRVQVQPEYYGLLAFARLTPPGSRLLRVPAMPSGLYAWAVRTPGGKTHVVITNVNATAARVNLKVPGAGASASVESLRAATGGLRAMDGVTLGGQSISPSTGQLSGPVHARSLSARNGAYAVTVAPASASIVTFGR